MKRWLQSVDFINLVLAIFSASLVVLSLLLVHYLGLITCSLCLLQRIIFAALALLFFIVSIHKPKRTLLNGYYNFALFFAVLGISLALRQIWLHYHIDSAAHSCLPGINYLLETMPLMDSLWLMLKGTEDCAKETWTLFGLTLATWSLISFLAILVTTLFLKRLIKRKHSVH